MLIEHARRRDGILRPGQEFGFLAVRENQPRPGCPLKKLLRAVLPQERHRRWIDRKIHTGRPDRKSTRLNSSHVAISYAVFCLKKKKKKLHTHIHKREE